LHSPIPPFSNRTKSLYCQIQIHPYFAATHNTGGGGGGGGVGEHRRKRLIIYGKLGSFPERLLN